jgi:cellulose synthase/poly-beta-1,6-N-acetylglucosamine synthase-like glycosyltransferase
MPAAHAAQILTGATSLLALGWLWQGLTALRGIPTLPDLNDPKPNWPELPANPQPDVTVVVPACNEEESIRATLTSLQASTGARLQIVAVNDRSADRTGAIMDEVAFQAKSAARQHTLEIVHIQELPPGWMGKAHALATGAGRSAAPWLLFTDGDMIFDPRAISLALRYARAEQADHVVLAFTLKLKSFAEAAVFVAFQALAAWNMPLWKVADPKSRAFFGAGGFNLVRRAVYEELGGFESLRMEVVEDLRLGWKIKRAGFRQRVVLGANLASIRWIQGALGIVGLLEKNGFAGMRYRTGIALLAFFGFAVQIVLPLAAIASGGWAAVAGVAVYAAIFLTYFANRRFTQASPWTAVLFAPATAVLLFAILRSMLLTLKRNGVVWRGTLYPLDELRRNAGNWR